MQTDIILKIKKQDTMTTPTNFVTLLFCEPRACLSLQKFTIFTNIATKKKSWNGHTQTINRLSPTNYLSMFYHFMGLALKGIMSNNYCLNYSLFYLEIRCSDKQKFWYLHDLKRLKWFLTLFVWSLLKLAPACFLKQLYMITKYC